MMACKYCKGKKCTGECKRGRRERRSGRSRESKPGAASIGNVGCHRFQLPLGRACLGGGRMSFVRIDLYYGLAAVIGALDVWTATGGDRVE